MTPGTIIEPGLLSADSNNYLASIVLDEDRAGIAYVDITTGEFAVTELDASPDLASVRAELTRLRPAEIIHPDNIILPDNIPGHYTAWPAWRFEIGQMPGDPSLAFRCIHIGWLWIARDAPGNSCCWRYPPISK